MNIQNDMELTIERVFDAPRELVWRAWTEPELFMRWWGPKEFTSPIAKIDLTVGGRYLNCMRGAAGPGMPVRDYWSTGKYKEIVPLEKLVYSDMFSDKHGNPVPASQYGMEGEWPMEMTVTVRFAQQDGKTRMALWHEGIPAGENSDLARAGWNESFDKLDSLLARERTA